VTGLATVVAQSDLAATLEVLAPGVFVQRVNTTNPIEVSTEAIVGVGSTIHDESQLGTISMLPEPHPTAEDEAASGD
jgi:hypothetical protein